jgi:HEAT repeat protein
MSDAGPSTDPIVRASHPDEETRYRAVPLLDPALPDERAALIARLADDSWRVRAAAVERLTAAEDPAPVLPLLLERLVGAGGVGEREAAAEALGRIGPPAIPGLVERLEATDPELRQAAAVVLGVIGDRRALPALVARLADADPNVRAIAADALGRIGGRDATAALLAAVDSDDASLRAAALQSLTSVRVAPSIEQLSRLVKDRASRRVVLRLLGFSDDRGVFDLLVQGLVDPVRSVRTAALAALGTLRARLTLEDLAPVARRLREAVAVTPDLADRMEEALTSEEPFAPVGAATALGWLGGARQAAALARLAEDDRYRPLVEETLEVLPQTVQVQAALFDVLPSLTPQALVTVAGAMARAGNEAAFRLLSARVGDPEPYVRTEAIAALGRLGDARAVEALASVLADDDPTVAVLAASAVVRLGQRDERSRAVVLRECRARIAARPMPALLRVIGALGGGEDVAMVRGLLSTGDAQTRAAATAAASALGARGILREQEIPELARALGDAVPAVRGAAARALADLSRAAAERPGGDGRSGPGIGREALDALRGALRDSEASVQASAAEALGASGRNEYAGALAALVTEGIAPPVVMVAALRGLMLLGAPSPAAVERALGHADAEVAKEGVAAAARIAGEAGAGLLRAAARSERWDVRYAVARALGERGDPTLGPLARELAAGDEDPLVAKAFAAAAEALAHRA